MPDMKPIGGESADLMPASFESKLFTNFTGKDFTYPYNSKPYTVEAGKTKSYPVFLANHLAKHLIDREIISSGKEVLLNDSITRGELATKIFKYKKPEEAYAKKTKESVPEVKAKVKEEVKKPRKMSREEALAKARAVRAANLKAK